MSIFAFILIYVGLAGVKYLLKQLTGNTQAETVGNELTEVFPTLSETSNEKPPLHYDELEKTAILAKKPDSQAPHFAALQSNDTASIEEGKKAHEKEDTNRVSKRIALTTREEARRAFIYTEIFNRKYE